jgi:hypothetical protein
VEHRDGNVHRRPVAEFEGLTIGGARALGLRQICTGFQGFLQRLSFGNVKLLPRGTSKKWGVTGKARSGNGSPKVGHLWRPHLRPNMRICPSFAGSSQELICRVMGRYFFDGKTLTSQAPRPLVPSPSVPLNQAPRGQTRADQTSQPFRRHFISLTPVNPPEPSR